MDLQYRTICLQYSLSAGNWLWVSLSGSKSKAVILGSASKEGCVFQCRLIRTQTGMGMGQLGLGMAGSRAEPRRKSCARPLPSSQLTAKPLPLYLKAKSQVWVSAGFKNPQDLGGDRPILLLARGLQKMGLSRIFLLCLLGPSMMLLSRFPA